MFPPLKWGRYRQQQEIQNKHSALETEQMLQDNCMFAHIHSTQEEGWHPIREVIATHTNSFSIQQEQDGITSLKEKMVVIS